MDFSGYDTSTGAFNVFKPDEPVLFKPEELADHCQPIRGSLTPSVEPTFLIEAVEGLNISEFSLYYMGMFILSSVVRYRPYLWANAISRRPTPSRRADDRALALIEAFMDSALTVIPEAVIVAMNEPYSGAQQ